jgi:hypothetical protein
MVFHRPIAPAGIQWIEHSVAGIPDSIDLSGGLHHKVTSTAPTELTFNTPAGVTAEYTIAIFATQPTLIELDISGLWVDEDTLANRQFEAQGLLKLMVDGTTNRKMLSINNCRWYEGT